MAFLVGGANSAVSGYDIDNSVRFASGDNSKLQFNPPTATSDKIGTFSCWFKTSLKGPLAGGSDTIFGNYVDGDDRVLFILDDAYRLQLSGVDNGTAWAFQLKTNALIRDTSAWYHIVVAWDTSQGTAANRIKMYLNGTQITSFQTADYPNQNLDFHFNDDPNLTIGRMYGSSAEMYSWDGYLADVAFVDGTQLEASNFGETDEDSGIWKPKEPDVSAWGNAGLFLEFKESAVGSGASNTIGADTSGNDNHLTSTGLAATDQCTDTPTNNFCTWNPLDGTDLSDLTFTEGNTKVVNATGVCRGTLAAASGKWYWEVKQLTTINGSNPIQYGVADTEDSPPTHSSLNNALIAYSDNDAQKSIKKFAAGTESTVSMTEFTSISVNDIIMFAFDADTAKLWVGINGTWLHSGDPAAGSNEVASTNSGNFFTPCLEHAGVTYTIESNFGNPPYSISSSQADDAGYGNFEYDVPAGFYALCTKNLAEYG